MYVQVTTGSFVETVTNVGFCQNTAMPADGTIEKICKFLQWPQFALTHRVVEFSSSRELPRQHRTRSVVLELRHIVLRSCHNRFRFFLWKCGLHEVPGVVLKMTLQT